MIDCFIIFGDAGAVERAKGIKVTDKMRDLPTLIYCNPNAGYYESLFYECDWIEFYISKGINIVLWNYRGYGCSEGFPSSRSLFTDCEYLVDYLR